MSRTDNHTAICSLCGNSEALRAWQGLDLPDQCQWPVAEEDEDGHPRPPYSSSDLSHIARCLRCMHAGEGGATTEPDPANSDKSST